MRSSHLGASLAALALAALAAPPPAVAAGVLRLPMCGGGFADVPLSGDDDRRGPKPAPSGCHALCLTERKSLCDPQDEDG